MPSTTPPRALETSDSSRRGAATTPPATNRLLRFDRRFVALGVERVQHSSGTGNEAEFVRRNHLLTRIANSGLSDLLQAFATGEVSIDDLLRFEREEDLRNGLTILREARDRERAAYGRDFSTLLSRTSVTINSPSTESTFEPTPLTPTPINPRAADADIAFQTSRAVSSGTELVPVSTLPVSLYDATDAVATGDAIMTELCKGIAFNTDFSKPLWSTFLGTTIPNMLQVVSATRRRYETSLNSLQLKIGACGATEAQFDVLATIGPNEWDALELARSRGLEVSVLRYAMLLTLAKQRALLAARNLRMPVDVFDALTHVTEDQWDVLADVAELPITSQMIEALDRAEPEDREALRHLAAKLGPDAPISALGLVTEGEWHAFSRCWGASSTDWNHMRRAISTCLSKYMGTNRLLFRQAVIDRMPLLKERERIPDITPEKLSEIVAALPETVRWFPWFIVLSGCRVGEYLRMGTEYLKPNLRMIDVPGTKNGQSIRTIHIVPALWWIAEAAVPCHLQYRQLRKHWKAACEQVGVHGLTIHDLRHVCGQTAADAGAKIESIQAHLGHANPEMALRYARRRELRDGSEKLGNSLLSHLPANNPDV